MVRKKRSGLIVVSSDRVIKNEAKAIHVPFSPLSGLRRVKEWHLWWHRRKRGARWGL
jgi:hypothetical protein